MKFIEQATPSRVAKFSHIAKPWLLGSAVVVLAAGLYGAFVTAPADYQQGETIRIMYIHVPMAWLAMFAYAMMASSAIATLAFKHPMADVSAKVLAPIGAVFTAVCLITGSLWGKPMWNTWWVWDARLTSVLILFLVYLGIISLWQAIEEPQKAGKVTAVVALIGAINLPIIKFSVDWWYTLHQPASVFRMDGPTIHPTMLYPLLICAVGFMLLFFYLYFAAMDNEMKRRRVRALQMRAARHEARSQARDTDLSGADTAPEGAA
ncbi:MAG: heme ABC transporter permease [Pseudomonadota bacterium]